MIPAEIQPVSVSKGRAEPLAADTEVSLLDQFILLLENKRFIARFVLISGALATIVAFLLPIQYEAKIVLLPPQQNSSLGSSLLGQLGGMGALGSLASLANGNLGIKNPADMYVSLLTSRSVEDAMIERFHLMEQYKQKRMSDARKVLEQHTSVTAGNKDGLIRISIEDRSPARAAELANGYVDEFRKLSASLAITEAARRRLFFAQQLQQTKENLTAAENAMTEMQRTSGVLEIDTQARALIESAATLRAQVAAKRVQIEGMRAFAAENNPDLVLAKQELAALEGQLARIAGSRQDPGSDINLSKGRVTQAGMEYLRRYRELKYQESVFELLAKEFEIAKLDEAREGSIVQVVDSAVPPDRKASPHRLLIVLGTTLFGFIVAVFWVNVRYRLEMASRLPENRHRMRLIKSLWRKSSKPI